MELRPGDLLKEWKSGRFRPVYYLLGEEAAEKAAALRQLKADFSADDFNFKEFSGDIASQTAAVLSEAMTLPVFSQRRLVIVSSPKLSAEARASFAEYLKDPLASTTLVLLSEDRKPDPKDALCRAAAAAGAVCVFNPLREDEARQRLQVCARQAGKSLSDEAAALLVEEAGTDWSVLSQELEKAALYSRKKDIGPDEVLACLGYRKSADPFALTRLIQERRLADCLAHLRRFLADGKPEDQAFRALSQISSAVGRQFKAKRLLKAGTPPEALMRSLRLHPYWDRDYVAQLGKFTDRRLADDARKCLETEAALKSKSWLDAKIELEHLVVGLCAARRGAMKAGA